jgi:hypothetical protein
MNVFWIRHSVSKSNISSLAEKAIFYFNYKDTGLAPGAVRESCELGKNWREESRTPELYFVLR